MSDTATVHVKEVKVVKEGTNAKGKWTMYGLVDGNDDLFSWFNNSTLYDEAKAFEDKRVEIEYEANDRGRNLKAIKAAAPTNGDTPPLGTGAYVTGQKPPVEARRIFSSTAWNNATKLAELYIAHAPAREWTPALIQEVAQHFAEQIFQDLVRRGHAFIDEEDIRF